MHKLEQWLGIAMQKPVVASPAEAFGQNMLQDQRDKRFPRQASGLPCLSPAVTAAEGDGITVIFQQMTIADYPTIRIAGEILQCLLTAPDFLALGHPLLGCDARIRQQHT
jgi:hypothetical protein